MGKWQLGGASFLYARQIARNIQLEVVATRKMPGDSCIVCGNSHKKQPKLKFFRFPSDCKKYALWLEEFKLKEVKEHHRVCSDHFIDGNPEYGPQLSVGRKFASLVQQGPRTMRAEARRKCKKSMSAAIPSRSAAVPPPSSSGSQKAPEAKKKKLSESELSERVHELETENSELRKGVIPKFTLDKIKDNDKLVCYYTGFESLRLFSSSLALQLVN